MATTTSTLQDWFNKKNSEAGAPKNSRWAPSIELEKQIGAQIYNALQGSVVEEVLKKTRISSMDTYYRSSLEGHSLKVEKELLSEFYDLCQEVKKKLNFEEDVEFYITGDSNVNAFSLSAEEEGAPHIININSALVTLMTRDEIKFVIGHELGHLINRDTALARLIGFVFPPSTTPPVTLQYKIRLHEQLAELVADRYGYMAVENLDACVTAFFKMASGLDLAKMNVSIDALLEDNTRRLNFFLNEQGLSRSSHPVNPIRVHALNLFANAVTESELEEGMNALISILLRVGGSELDENIAKFIASAGIIMANMDSEITKEEVEQIINTLATHMIFPRHYLDEIAKGDVWNIFNGAVAKILEINPGMKMDLVSYTIGIVMADKMISKDEIELIYQFGGSIGLSDIEVAHAIAESIQRNYMPSLDSIC